eukprot:Nitzschia sp. Nitz4//scaffold145_size56662//22128//23204//NITZ4_006555-RA/size56662-processed-gene-0.14-mRNA-1//1//CDS//3329536571//5925//frame0
MWRSVLQSTTAKAAGALSLASVTPLYYSNHHNVGTGSAPMLTQCQEQATAPATTAVDPMACLSDKSNPDNIDHHHLLRVERKLTSLRQATATHEGPPRSSYCPSSSVRRADTRQQLKNIRSQQHEIFLRWQRDEDGWRKLPARAWPPVQPTPEQLEALRQQFVNKNCSSLLPLVQVPEEERVTWPEASGPSKGSIRTCQKILFQMATALVFYHLDPATGYQIYLSLAKQGHVDSMVACGIVLVEGLGVSPQEQEGLLWLEQAVARNSAQACYELGTILYTGIDEVVQEDLPAAVELFRRAAERQHVAAMYMYADCLAEGDGVPKDVAKAVPLFYQAAEHGHRFARQRIRELLQSYPEE